MKPTQDPSVQSGNQESAKKHGKTPANQHSLTANASPTGSAQSTAVQNQSADPITALLQQRPKLRRAEKKVINRAAMLQAQVEGIAKSATPRFATSILMPTESGEMLPAKLGERLSNQGGKGGKAKQVTAVMGRPSEYTKEEADIICAWISSGKSMNSYCKQFKRDHVTIYRWLREHADFHARYGRAHEDRADTLVDEMIEIADDSSLAPSIEAVSAAKLRVETRRWIAMKMRASKYGDKVEVKQTGAVNIRIGITAKDAALPAVDVIEDGIPVGTTSAPLINR